MTVYAAKSKDDTLRMQSSSGGLFTLLARQVLSTGGIVYGAGWTDDFIVVHKSAINEAELEDLRGSKYTQSEVGLAYREAKKHLEQGQKVLFSGTPCQIAGLKACLGCNYGNLLCVDFICHAVSSPKVFALYKKALELRYNATTERISFRRKDYGWKKFSMAFTFQNGKEYVGTLDKDPFLQGFLNEIFNRPSCHSCLFRELRSGADITLADYWNVHTLFPELDDDQGVSMVLVNTECGQKAYSEIERRTVDRISTFGDVKRCNSAVILSNSASSRRAAFFRRCDQKSILAQIKQALRPTMRQRIKQLGRKLVKLIRQRIRLQELR